MKLIESQTYLNLARAYAGECQARTRYEFVEYGARYNGYTALSEIIDKVVYQEFNHARMLYTYIQQADKKIIDDIKIDAGFPFKEKWNLEENLKLLAEDEKNEAKIYREFTKVAKSEGFTEIAQLFTMIEKVEKEHQALFELLHKQLKNKTMYKKSQPVTWECSSCGYKRTSEEAWEECPLCKAKRGYVKLILDC
ncbi:MAG: hypothetical protein NC350_04200 [Corallococcus sp.]|nr:hypothetical protein [Corallococcus sp.]